MRGRTDLPSLCVCLSAAVDRGEPALTDAPLVLTAGVLGRQSYRRATLEAEGVTEDDLAVGGQSVVDERMTAGRSLTRSLVVVADISVLGDIDIRRHASVDDLC